MTDGGRLGRWGLCMNGLDSSASLGMTFWGMMGDWWVSVFTGGDGVGYVVEVPDRGRG